MSTTTLRLCDIVKGIKSNQYESCRLPDTITEPADIEAIADSLAYNNSLVKLSLKDITITNKTLLKIIQNIGHNPKFEMLDLAWSTIKELNEKQIGDALSETSIQRIRLQFSNISQIQALSISHNLSREKKPKVIIHIWSGDVQNGKIKKKW